MKSVFDYKTLEFTTFKIREEVEKRIIDYIFFKGNILFGEECKSDIKIDENLGLPNLEFPSDHLYLKANFQIK